MGEAIARSFLRSKGLDVIAGNIEVAGGEIDLLAVDNGRRVAVEVRTSTTRDDPIDAVGHAKRRQVRRLAGAVGADRVDFVGVGIEPGAAVIHWVPDGA